MLKVAKVFDTPSTHRLVKVWSLRYTPNLSTISPQNGRFPHDEVLYYASSEGRAKTVENVRQILRLNYGAASLEANTLVSYIPHLVSLSEARELTSFVLNIYEQILDLYQHQPPPSYFLKFIDTSFDVFNQLMLPALVLPLMTQLADQFAETLLQIQGKYQNVKDRRTVGFLTTHFHFTTRELTKHLSSCEKVLLTPYFKFVEEQLCIPWQRICAAAAKYPTNSLIFQTAERIVSNTTEVAIATYRKGADRYSQIRSRRGHFTHPDIALSTIRDITMIQGYLALSLLEGNVRSIEQELLPLCLMVFPNVEVRWELVEQMLKILVEQMRLRLSPDQRQVYMPYANQLLRAFNLRSETVLPFYNR